MFFHNPTRNGPDENRGCSVYTGWKENFDIENGSCETSRMKDSEGTERHLETPISLTGIGKKEEPKTNNRLCHVFVLGSYWRRWGNAIHVHNTLYSLRWLYYITEILPCQQILPTVAPRGITLPLAFSSASPPRSRRSRCLA